MKRRDLIRKLQRLGFQGPLQGRKHPFMTKGNRRITLPNPHGNNDIDISLIRRIVRQAGLDWRTGRTGRTHDLPRHAATSFPKPEAVYRPSIIRPQRSRQPGAGGA